MVIYVINILANDTELIENTLRYRSFDLLDIMKGLLISRIWYVPPIYRFVVRAPRACSVRSGATAHVGWLLGTDTPLILSG